MKISVVVPAFNEEKLIVESLQRIDDAGGAFRALGWHMERVVCDNNSTDRTSELARTVGARVVFEPINQIARSRNCGAAASQGHWLVFVDADTHPSSELFGEVAEQIQTGTCLAGGSTVRIDEKHMMGNLVTQGWNWISRAAKWAAGSFIFCETSAFWEVGGFNQELFASEEIDLSKRLKRLARVRRKRFVILHRHPVMTSARKIHLYTRAEYLRFFMRLVLHPRQTLRRREACPTWYDGRR